MNVIRSQCHEIYTEEINKISLTSEDNKRVVIADGIHTLAYGHTNLNNCNKKMSFNMIQNIVVDSVVLPNKSLSNLEIIDAVKKLSLNGFRGIFLRDTLSKKAKLMNVVF